MIDESDANVPKDNIAKETAALKGVNNERKEPAIKKSREKSVKYPYYSIEKCIDYLNIIHKIGGRKGAQIGSILSEMNINSPNNNRLSYLNSSSEIFGLIEKSDQTIKPTELGILILFPPNGEGQKKQLLIRSIKNSEIYANIIDKYNENILPNRDFLRTEFYHLKIAPAVLDQAVNSFIESIQYVSVLDEDNRLLIPPEITTVTSTAMEKIYPQKPERTTLESDNQKISQMQTQLKANLPSEEKVDIVRFEVMTSTGLKATVCIPSKCSQEDIEKIKKIVSAYGPDK